MNIGSKTTELKTSKKWSQSELAKQLDASRTIIGNYERNENTPSIDMILKLAKVFNVSIDYLVGDGKNAHYNKKTLQIIDDIETLESSTRDKLYFLINAIIRDSKTRQAYL